MKNLFPHICDCCKKPSLRCAVVYVLKSMSERTICESCLKYHQDKYRLHSRHQTGRARSS